MPNLSRGVKYGTLVMDATTSGIRVERILAVPMHTLSLGVRQGADLGVVQSEQFEGARVTMNGVIAGTNYDDLQGKIDDFLYAFAQGEQDLRVWSNVSPSNERVLPAYPKKIPEVDFFPNGVMNAAAFSCEMASVQPTWHESTETTSSFAMTSSPKTQVLTTNSGTAKAFPTLVITNNTTTAITAARVLLTNLSSAKTLSFTGLSIEIGETLTLDFQRQRVAAGTLQAARFASIEGQWWSLAPSAAAQVQVVTDATLDGSGLQFDFSWNAQYWSP